MASGGRKKKLPLVLSVLAGLATVALWLAEHGEALSGSASALAEDLKISFSDFHRVEFVNNDIVIHYFPDFTLWQIMLLLGGGFGWLALMAWSNSRPGQTLDIRNQFKSWKDWLGAFVLIPLLPLMALVYGVMLSNAVAIVFEVFGVLLGVLAYACSAALSVLLAIKGLVELRDLFESARAARTLIAPAGAADSPTGPAEASSTSAREPSRPESAT